ncbi:MAG: GNAT family N-acetyltransferase, partial [Proteobacteria bacterium]|nr:GNAT family N-acetyltransferase [Pseudomonadota bacterium]
FVAQSGNQIIGLLHVYARPAIERPTEAVVQSLVVDATRRKSGIGSILMDTAERWAAARGLTTVALSSNVVRTEAHAFYQGRGYAIAATSHVFRKTIGA